jgi:hypothetical protein
MLRISKYIDLPLFVISFFLGLCAVYYFGYDDLRKIYVYPTPENAEQLQYRDANQTCYETTPVEVACPADRSQLAKMHTAPAANPSSF